MWSDRHCWTYFKFFWGLSAIILGFWEPIWGNTVDLREYRAENEPQILFEKSSSMAWCSIIPFAFCVCMVFRFELLGEFDFARIKIQMQMQNPPHWAVRQDQMLITSRNRLILVFLQKAMTAERMFRWVTGLAISITDRVKFSQSVRNCLLWPFSP